MFRDLLKLCPGLEDRLLNSSTSEEIQLISDLVSLSSLNARKYTYVPQIQKGASASRGDDTKGMKGSIVDWITPEGQSLNPPLNRRQKLDRGFRHEATGALLCPAALDWKDKE